jgi:hypothetical protein
MTQPRVPRSRPRSSARLSASGPQVHGIRISFLYFMSGSIKPHPRTFDSFWMQNISNPLKRTRSVIKVESCEVVLIVGYNDILRASEEARGEDFSTSKKNLVRKFRSNPFLHFYTLLSTFFITQSAEAIDMVRSKARSHSTSPKKKAKVTEPIDDDKLFLLQQSPPRPTDPNFPIPTQSTPVGNKRVLSGESYGHSSTETTPTKIVQAESLTQSLQNNLVEILINNIWLGQVDVLWARNREMYLDYRPYIQIVSADL